VSVTSYAEAEDLPSDVAGGDRSRGLRLSEWSHGHRLGRVVDGRVEVDSELPEGTSVTLLAREGDPETERILATPSPGASGETVPIAQLLGELRYCA
jgi:hypothetical protein